MIQSDHSLAQLFGVWDYMHELCAIYQGNLVRIESRRENNCLVKYILDKVGAHGEILLKASLPRSIRPRPPGGQSASRS